MMSSTTIFISLILAVSAADTFVHTFAQEWPGGICRESQCQAAYLLNYDGKRFNMHGLWPNINTPTYCKGMDTCTNDIFNAQKISSQTMEKIDVGWVGLYADTETFRKHEYEKHGTCFSGSNIDFFFSTVIALAQKYNVYDALAASGIYPNENTPITMTQVVNAMQSYLNNTNADIHMSCVKEASTGRYHIGQVKFCMGDDFKPRSCVCSAAVDVSESTHSNEESNLKSLVGCPSTLYYAPFQSVAIYE